MKDFVIVQVCFDGTKEYVSSYEHNRWTLFADRAQRFTEAEANTVAGYVQNSRFFNKANPLSVVRV